MVTMTHQRTIHPVMPPVNRSFNETHYSVFGDGPSTVQRKPRGLAFTGGMASLLQGLSTLTRFITLSVLAFLLLMIPGVAGGIAYHVVSNNTAITVVRTQEVPESGVEQPTGKATPINPETTVRSANP